MVAYSGEVRHRRVWAALAVATALTAGLTAPVSGRTLQSASASADAASAPALASAPIASAPKPHHVAAVAQSAKPAAAKAPVMTAADSAVAASENADYHDELMAAAASLKADIKAESDASAAEVSDAQSGPTGLGMMVAGGVIVFAILVSLIVIPATLRARRKRREMVADMISGKPRSKK